jgi:hypothetical protein
MKAQKLSVTFKTTELIENTLRVPLVFWQLFKEKRKPTDPTQGTVEKKM